MLHCLVDVINLQELGGLLAAGNAPPELSPLRVAVQLESTGLWC